MVSTRSKGFPRLSLKNAVQIMDKAMKYGRNWSKEEFAAFGSKTNTKGSANSGAFAYRLAALKDYGLITSSKEGVLATDLASRIVKPINDDEYAEAVKEAFLNPAVFSEIIETVEHETELSKTAISEKAVRKLGISRDHMSRFAKNFLDSGKLAGIITETDADHFIIKLYSEKPDNVSTTGTDSKSTDTTNVVPDAKPDNRIQNTTGGRDISGSSEASIYGAQHKGQSWQLNLQILVDIRVPASLRTEIRSFVANADTIADKLYELEESGGE